MLIAVGGDWLEHFIHFLIFQPTGSFSALLHRWYGRTFIDES